MKIVNAYGYEISIEKQIVEGRKEIIIVGLPKSIINRIEDHIREWQSNEFDPAGILEIPTEIESILLDWLPEQNDYLNDITNIIVNEDGSITTY